jgi:hypothetical protein
MLPLTTFKAMRNFGALFATMARQQAAEHGTVQYAVAAAAKSYAFCLALQEAL